VRAETTKYKRKVSQIEVLDGNPSFQLQTTQAVNLPETVVKRQQGSMGQEMIYKHYGFCISPSNIVGWGQMGKLMFVK
jgi:hypothetical protein